MKKILKYTGITLGVIFLLLLIAPFLFKGKIVDAVKQAANDNLNASVNFSPLLTTHRLIACSSLKSAISSP
jgi:hypothetical protein